MPEVRRGYFPYCNSRETGTFRARESGTAMKQNVGGTLWSACMHTLRYVGELVLALPSSPGQRRVKIDRVALGRAVQTHGRTLTQPQVPAAWYWGEQFKHTAGPSHSHRYLLHGTGASSSNTRQDPHIATGTCCMIPGRAVQTHLAAHIKRSCLHT